MFGLSIDRPTTPSHNKGAFAYAKAPFLLPKPIFGYRHTADTPSFFGVNG